MGEFNLFGSAFGGSGLFTGAQIAIVIVFFIAFIALIAWVVLIMSREKLKISVLGVKGRILTGSVYKKRGQRFVKIRGRRDPIIYPSDECIIPIGKMANLAVGRQVGDDLVFYNIRDMKMGIGDNRLMRQQHALMKKEIEDKYDTKHWWDKAAPFFALATFGVLMFVFMVISKKVICG